jgi:predicted DCC family thiol-disulfide oxidoreductase YuxK
VSQNNLLIFDRDCAFCQSCVAWGKRNLKKFPQAIGYQDLDMSKYGLTEENGRISIWLIPESSKPLDANLAVAAILQGEPNYFWRLLGYLMNSYWIKPVARNLYFWVAKNRGKLPGASAECEVPKK